MTNVGKVENTAFLYRLQKNVRDILIPSEEESIKMFPMDFEEFLWANNNNIYADAIRDAFEKKKHQLKVNERYIIYTKDLSKEDNVTYIPIYMTMCL